MGNILQFPANIPRISPAHSEVIPVILIMRGTTFNSTFKTNKVFTQGISFCVQKHFSRYSGSHYARNEQGKHRERPYHKPDPWSLEARSSPKKYKRSPDYSSLEELAVLEDDSVALSSLPSINFALPSTPKHWERGAGDGARKRRGWPGLWGEEWNICIVYPSIRPQN